MLKNILLVGIGGGLGSILRFLTSFVVAKYYINVFPLATFLINILGCFIIGCLIGFFGHQATSHANFRFLLVTGFCGGYTTFSTFASENISLLQTQHYLSAVLYIGASVLFGLIAVWLGLMATS